jgi:hypothetical protein
MSGYNLLSESGSNEMPSGGGAPAIAVGEPNPGAPIPVEPNGVPGGDVGPLYSGNPLSHLLEDLSSWFPTGNNHGSGYPPFYAAPSASGEGPYIIPGYDENSPGPSDGLDW